MLTYRCINSPSIFLSFDRRANHNLLGFCFCLADQLTDMRKAKATAGLEDLITAQASRTCPSAWMGDYAPPCSLSEARPEQSMTTISSETQLKPEATTIQALRRSLQVCIAHTAIHSGCAKGSAGGAQARQDEANICQRTAPLAGLAYE